MIPNLIHPIEAARRLGMSPRVLAELRRTGQISHVRLSERKIRYTEAQLAEYIAKRIVSAGSLGDGNQPKGETPCIGTPTRGSFMSRSQERAERELDDLLAQRT